MILSRITFPGLGISVDPPTEAFSIGSVHVYWYGIILATGFLLGVMYCLRRAKEFGITQDEILDGLFIVTPVAIICARIYYCVFNWSLFADNPISCLYIWEGGIALYGSLIGAIGMAIIYTRWRKIPIRPVLDLISLGFVIGQFIGRWGNFVNREAHGTVTDTFLRMGLEDAAGNVTYYHPTFLYESLWNFAGFVFLHFFVKRRKYDGQIFTMYITWYGLGRALIEGLRTDSLYLFGSGIRVSQLLAAVSFAAAAVLLRIRLRAHPDPERMYVHTRDKAQENREQDTKG